MAFRCISKASNMSNSTNQGEYTVTKQPNQNQRRQFRARKEDQRADAQIVVAVGADWLAVDAVEAAEGAA
jgi:hypothetical protein